MQLSDWQITGIYFPYPSNGDRPVYRDVGGLMNNICNVCNAVSATLVSVSFFPSSLYTAYHSLRFSSSLIGQDLKYSDEHGKVCKIFRIIFKLG